MVCFGWIGNSREQLKVFLSVIPLKSSIQGTPGFGKEFLVTEGFLSSNQISYPVTD